MSRFGCARDHCRATAARDDKEGAQSYEQQRHQNRAPLGKRRRAQCAPAAARLLADELPARHAAGAERRVDVEVPSSRVIDDRLSDGRRYVASPVLVKEAAPPTVGTGAAGLMFESTLIGPFTPAAPS